MAIALLLFFALLIVGRSELGIRGIAICISLASVVIAVILLAGLSLILLGVAAAILDIGLIFYIFGGDIPIRPQK